MAKKYGAVNAIMIVLLLAALAGFLIGALYGAVEGYFDYYRVTLGNHMIECAGYGLLWGVGIVAGLMALGVVVVFVMTLVTVLRERTMLRRMARIIEEEKIRCEVRKSFN